MGATEHGALGEGGIAARDLDGDGLADLATDSDVPLSAVYVFNGSDLTAGASLTEADASATIMGSARGGVARRPGEGGDVDGDGYDDLLVRQMGDAIDGVALWYGRSPLLSGTHTTSEADVVFVDGPSSDGTVGTLKVGTEFEGSGDMDGDGRADLVIDGALDNVEARSWFFHGSSVLAAGTVPVSDADVSFAVPVEKWAGNYLWGGIAGGKDVNGDDIPDLLIGDPERDVAYLVYGW